MAPHDADQLRHHSREGCPERRPLVAGVLPCGSGIAAGTSRVGCWGPGGCLPQPTPWHAYGARRHQAAAAAHSSSDSLPVQCRPCDSCAGQRAPEPHLSSERNGQRQLAEQLLCLGAAPHLQRRQPVLAHRRLRFGGDGADGSCSWQDGTVANPPGTAGCSLARHTQPQSRSCATLHQAPPLCPTPCAPAPRLGWRPQAVQSTLAARPAAPPGSPLFGSRSGLCGMAGEGRTCGCMPRSTLPRASAGSAPRASIAAVPFSGQAGETLANLAFRRPPPLCAHPGPGRPAAESP